MPQILIDKNPTFLIVHSELTGFGGTEKRKVGRFTIFFHRKSHNMKEHNTLSCEKNNAINPSIALDRLVKQ